MTAEIAATTAPNQSAEKAPNKSEPRNELCSITQKIILGINICLIIGTSIGIAFTYVAIHQLYLDQTRVVNSPTQTKLAKALRCFDTELKPMVRHYSQYWILQNYIIGVRSKRTTCASRVTFTTHGRDIGFFKHLPKLVFNWRAPISVALFTPADDFNLTLSAIQYARNCLNESSLITDFVSFHLIIPDSHMPSKVPHGNESPLSWPFSCHTTPPHEAVSYQQTYAYKQRLPYPVNIMRNIARRATNTYYHLSADVEYIPSLSMESQFMEFIFKKVCNKMPNDAGNGEGELVCSQSHGTEDLMKIFHLLPEGLDNMESIYVMPVVTLRKDVIAPQTKAEVLGLSRKNLARVTQADDLFYIADTAAPYYDERFYWEPNGLHNVPRYYAICLLEFKSINMYDQFMFIYEASPLVYPSTAIYTNAASYLNNSILQLEYVNLYSPLHEEQCKTCFAKRKNCLV